MTDPSAWEDQAVSDLIGAAIPQLSGFQIEALNNQVDFEKDQLVTAVPHLLVAWTGADHEHGFFGGDPFTLAFVAVVPGGSQRERRSLAINALSAIASWMRDPAVGSPYQPNKSAVERLHPLAVATLTASRVG
jgi:hypothetical protein